MSTLQYPETAATAPHLQVWNNAAFDGGDENLQGFSSIPMQASWSSLHSSDSSKENLSPAALNSTTPFPSKPLLSTAKKKTKCFDDREDEKKIDDEIQEIENEIKRLSFRMESLRLQKAAAAVAKTAEKRGRIVPAKFMEQKHSSGVKVIEETPKTKVSSVMRRGVSLGPAEISAEGGRFSRWPGKVNANAVGGITPVPATTQSRRKSFFWKLEEVDELKGGVSERKKTLSLSPKSKRIVGRGDSIQGVKHVATAATVTVGTRKGIKKDDVVVGLVQPRKLFKEGEKSSVPNKKPAAKAGRVVASRYNSVASADARKRSWPENNKDDAGGQGGKRRTSLRGNGQGSEVRVKKRWEIPAQVVVYQKSEEKEEEEEKNPDVLLPKIRTLRRNPIHSPRDSGAAKRVADLTGKRSYFCPDEHVEASVCQVLNFAEEDADE